jgi:BlaI family transcriptional regulator, penicillinase repressor
MPNTPSISDAEWEVISILWDASPLTAGQVVERLKGRKQWSPRTVKSLLNRLVKKRAVGFTEESNFYLYRPLVTRRACVRRESRGFASRVFGGAVGPMLVHFVRQADLSADEIEELKRALIEKSRQR